MIKNINLMQNPHDIAWDRYSEEYVIQALANLGQRIGIKGDGVAYKSFTFNDILSSNLTFDSNTHIGYIEYIKNNDNVIDDIESSKYKANFGVTLKNDLNNIINIDTTLSINDILYFPQELSFTINVNNIEKYSKNSICCNKDNELTYILAGKLIGYEDNVANNTVLIYEKFDTLTNKLKYASKLFYFGNTYPGEYYCLINTKNDSYDSNKLSNKYTMTIYLFDVNNINNENLRESFKNIFSFKNYNNVDQLPFNLLDANFIDISALESYNDDENKYFESNSPIGLIINNIKNNSKYIPQNIYLNFDAETNQLLSQDLNHYESVIDLYNNEYELNLDEEIFLLNNDINILYYNIFNYYNEKFYLEDRASFIKRILAKTYEAVSEYSYKNSYRLYIPLDYQFHYICNNNNEMQVYYSNNIYVTLTSLDSVYLEDFWINNKNLIYDYNGINKVKAYNFEINYNLSDNSIINSVLIKDIYTMPYINAEENWSINDIDTKIKAIGENAGNPNILVIYNFDKNDDKNSSFEILSTISHKENISNNDYELRWFDVNNALFNNIYTDTIKCCAYIPKVDDLNLKYFKNSIILSISDLNCLEYNNYKYDYKGSYILTLWHLIENEYGEFKFEYIHQSDTKYSLALGSTVNLLNETDDGTIANLNTQDLILLKSILNTVGQERLAINNNNWLIIKNKQSEEYYSSAANDNLYNNDLNTIVQYNDTIQLNSNHIIHSQNSKYVSSLDNLSVTNSLYPKYTVTTVIKNSTEAVEKLKKIDDNIISTKIRESRVTVKGQMITNIESLIEELNSGVISVTELKDVKIEEAKKITSNYNEYIFNSNIPSIDFKEVFNRNVNVLNRINIISLDQKGKLYNAYLGTSYDESDKNTLHIGTSSTNINVGTDTLFNEIDKSKFNKHNALSLDFDNIILNSKNQLIEKTNPIYQYANANYTFNISSISLISKRMENDITVSNGGHTGNWNNNSTEIFARQIITVNNSQTKNYFISINSIMKRCFNVNLTDYTDNIVFHIIDNEYIETEQPFKIVRDSLNDIVYLYKLNSNKVYDNLPNNTIYVPGYLNMMYYIDSDANNAISIIHIFISFNK